MTVRIPDRLLLDRGISKSAKLIWLHLRLSPEGIKNPPPIRLLEQDVGLSRPTIRNALDQLGRAGWLGSKITADRTWASIPRALIKERSLGATAILAYGVLQLTPGFRFPGGHFTYDQLRDLTGAAPKTWSAAIKELRGLQWVRTWRGEQNGPSYFTLENPDLDHKRREVAAAQRRLEKARFRGEALMREYLSLIVNSDEFQDDATPGFLVNPTTGEKIQFDRFYPPDVAFEFNGPQHYGPTALYPDEEAFRKQRARDLIKIGLCKERSIKLEIVRAPDLVLHRMLELAGRHLPLRNLEGHEMLVQYLETQSRKYRHRAMG